MLISIITVVFNNRDKISHTIESVISQTYDDIEYIVIDGDSTDGTIDVIKLYKKNINIIISEKDNGLYDALNKGISIASGEVVGFLHSDDFFANEHVVALIANKFINNNADIVYGDLDFVSSNNYSKVVRHWKAGCFSMKKLNYGWMAPHPTLYVKRQLYLTSGFFDTRFFIAADYESMVRLFKMESIIVEYIPSVLVKMTLGGISNGSFKGLILKSLEDYKIIKKYRIGGFFTLLFKNLSKISQFYDN